MVEQVVLQAVPATLQQATSPNLPWPPAVRKVLFVPSTLTELKFVEMGKEIQENYVMLLVLAVFPIVLVVHNTKLLQQESIVSLVSTSLVQSNT